MTKVKDLVSKYGDREIDEVELEKILKPVKVKTIYDLEYGDTYWAISSYFRILCTHENAKDTYEKMLSVGNVFLTEVEAEFEIERRKVKAELKRYASMCEEPVDWKNNDQTKYALCYDTKNKVLEMRSTWLSIDGDVFFTDKSILEQAIKEIGEERIEKYYLGVKGEDK